MSEITLLMGVNSTLVEEINTPDIEAICVICRDNLNTDSVFKLPECNHSFHTSCIISWFRRNHNTCPCCNHTGDETDEYGDVIRYRPIHSEKVKLLRQFARRNDAPKLLKQIVNKIKEYELKHKLLSAEFKILQNKSGKYNDIIKKIRQHRAKMWRCSTVIRQQQRLLTDVKVLPFVIIKK